MKEWEYIDLTINDAFSELANAIGDGGGEGMSAEIPTGTDLNDINKSGFYTASSASTILHKPTTETTFFGLLVIRRSPSTGYATQICFAGRSGRTREYIRHYNGTSRTWTDWQEYSATIVRLGGSEDLNDITFSGFSVCAGGNTVQNKPEGANAFGLLVFRLAPTTDYLMQFCVCGGSDAGYYKLWSRCLNPSGWTPWSMVYEQGHPHYVKPEGGIPKSDMESGVQTSLEKADTAMQYKIIPNNADLDDYKESGFFCADQGNSIANKPQTQSYNFGMLVIRRHPTIDHVTQIVMYGSSEYMRRCSSGTWSAWTKMTLV